ncbi:MAG: hypothetical protein JXB15_00270 [Anaerolineales bacterium]|nr:hypothetical protein [Anaerolineales bacterium]
MNKTKLKQLLGEVPLAPEIYWRLRQKANPPGKGFNLGRIEKWLPELRQQAQEQLGCADRQIASRRIVIFPMLRYWIEHAALLGLALAGLGHQVSLAYLPYAKWRRPLNRFDLRRMNAYASNILEQARPLIQPISLLDIRRSAVNCARQNLPPSLLQAIAEVSLRDTQYTLQVEYAMEDLSGDHLEQADEHEHAEATHHHLSPTDRLYQLRQGRNTYAAAAFITWYQSLPVSQRPEILLTPNGSILEMGAVYQAARHLGLPVVTYEFGEQRGRIWLAHNDEVMLQNTDDLWHAFKDIPLTEQQWEQIRSLYASRQNASLWENFSRLWQGQPSQGGEQVRQTLGLDARPLVLLAANVIGDSLTLGRQVFSQTMTEWLERTAQYFTQREDIQLVIRIHPGERYTKGPSVAQVVQNALPSIPANIHLVKALDPVNTYDLVEIADLGLVYTTTVGMEMAMSGVPTIVAGQTHYRDKGFTLDPNTWDEYHQLLGEQLTRLARGADSHSQDAGRLPRQQVERAWQYAYRFFFDYPSPFPWHLLRWWTELESWPIRRVLSAEGLEAYGETFRYLAGEPRTWSN